ncbi:MAG: hypothetical protein Q8K70_08460 [Bacteroidota bacterium]|nr:hypothetical protein [Bacteroidota bacterium]
MRNNYITKASFLLLFILQLNLLNAQKTKTDKNGPSSNIASFLDDGLGTKRYNLIRLRLSRLAVGFVGLTYERKISNKFGIEAGGFYQAFNGLNALDITYMGYAHKNQIQALLFPKFYRTGKAMNKGYYWGPSYRFMTASIDVNQPDYSSNNYSDINFKGNFTGHMLTLTRGSHKQISKNFTFGFEVGIGAYLLNYNLTKSDPKDPSYKPSKLNDGFIEFAVPIDINFGFLF